MNKNIYKTVVIKKLDKSLITEWKQLWKKAENANIYNSYEWFLTCLDTKIVKEYVMYVCYKNDKLVALLPMQDDKCFGVAVSGTIAKQHLVDTAFLIESYDKEVFKHFFGNILTKKNIYFQKIDDRSARILLELFPKALFSLMSVNPLINFTEDPYASASHSTISHVKKIIRKNKGLHLETYSSDLDEKLEIVFNLQEKSSKKVRAMDIFANEENKNYYRNLIKYCGQFIRLNILSLNAMPIAYEIGSLCKDRYMGDQISYHNDFKKLSPGRTMMFFLVQYLKDNNVKSHDMGGGITAYKMTFAKEYRLLYNVYYSENMFVMMWWKVLNKIRRVKQILFPKKFTRDHEFLFKTL